MMPRKDRPASTRSTPMETGRTSESQDSPHIGGLGSYSDLSTAVNTPFAMTPGGSHQDLHDPTWRPTLIGARHSGRSSTCTIAENAEKTGVSRSDEAIQEEMALKQDVARRGSLRHGGSDEKDRDTDDGPVLERQYVDLGHGIEPVIIVNWAPGDTENPFNWPNRRKYITVWVAVFTTALTALNCTSIAVLAAGGAPEHYGVSRQEYTLAVTMLVFAIANTPLVLAPISEVFGRNMIYQVTSIITMVLFIPQAITTNFSAILAIRWFQGMSSSVGNSMVGGTIADIFRAEDRGSGMNIFSVVIFAGQSMGGVLFGWIAMNLGIRWCYWIQAILGAFSCILNAIFLRETRSDVLLSRRARHLTMSTGQKHMCAADLQKQSFSTLLSVSVVRPLKFLVTEPIVTALSAWIGFAWACVFMGGTSVLLVFQQYDWNLGQLGSIQLVVFLGGLIGWATNHHQERLYARSAARHGGKAPPEARLYYAAYGGLAFPLAMFIFAWVGRPSVHWAVPAIMLVVVNWGIYCMYSGVFNYLADAYETYSSSAQAAHSWVRNMVSGIFPLFAHQMYVNLGYPVASTVVASIALVLAAAPLLLLRYGRTLRAKSPVTSALEAAAAEQR